MIINEITAYILGIFWADATINDGKWATLEILFDDAYYVNGLFEAIDISLHLAARERTGKQKIGALRLGSRDNTQNILNQLMVENDYIHKSILSPNKILNIIPKQYHRDFIRGWFDGDGCWYVNEKTKRVQFSVSGNYDQDWSALTEYLKELNISYSCQKNIQNQNNHINKHSRIRVTGKPGIQKLIEFLYYPNCSSLPRKNTKIEQIKIILGIDKFRL